MKFYAPKLLKLAHLFESISELKEIKLQVSVSVVGQGYEDLILVGVYSINAERIDIIGRIEDGDNFISQTSDFYQSFLIAANLKHEEMTSIVQTLKEVGGSFFYNYPKLKREDFIGWDKL